MSDPFAVPMSVLDLPVRVYRALQRAGLRTVGEVQELAGEEKEEGTPLEGVRQIGPKGAAQIRAALVDWQVAHPQILPTDDLGCTWARGLEKTKGV